MPPIWVAARRGAHLQNLAAAPAESSGHQSAAVAVTTAHSSSSGASLASHAGMGSAPMPPEAAQHAHRIGCCLLCRQEKSHPVLLTLGAALFF